MLQTLLVCKNGGFKTTCFANFERASYLIFAIFKISNFKTSKDKTEKNNFILYKTWGEAPGGHFR